MKINAPKLVTFGHVYISSKKYISSENVPKFAYVQLQGLLIGFEVLLCYQI